MHQFLARGSPLWKRVPEVFVVRAKQIIAGRLQVIGFAKLDQRTFCVAETPVKTDVFVGGAASLVLRGGAAGAPPPASLGVAGSPSSLSGFRFLM